MQIQEADTLARNELLQRLNISTEQLDTMAKFQLKLDQLARKILNHKAGLIAHATVPLCKCVY